MTVINNNPLPQVTSSKTVCRKLDALGWGFFLVWIGIAVLTDVGWGIFLIGVGVLIIGKLAAGEYLLSTNRSRDTQGLELTL